MTHKTEIQWLQDKLEISEQTSLGMVRQAARMTIKMSDQQREIERLREALTDMVSLFSADDWLTNKAPLPVGHALKAARAALQPKEGEG
jgi:hypothetical protein